MDGVRIVNRIVSALLALVLLLGGALVVVEVVLAALDREPWVLPSDDWARRARETAFEDRSARIFFAVLAAAGLALLILQLLKRRSPTLPMMSDESGVEADLDRRGAERWLTARLAEVEGVMEPRAKVARRSVEVTGQTLQRDVTDVEARLEQAAQRRVDELDLAEPLPARAKVTSRRQG